MSAAGRVLISGAGPVGLSLGLALARRGVEVDVFEADDALSDEMRASTLHASTLEMFAEWGVVDEVLAQGRRIDRLQYWDRTERTLVAELPYALIASDTPYPFRLQCPQNVVTRILKPALEATGRGRVHLGHRTVGVRQGRDEVSVDVVTASGVRTFSGTFAVGADGSRSAVRTELGLSLEGKTYPDQFLLVGTDLELGRYFPGIGGVAYLFDPVEWVICMQLPQVVRTVFRLDHDVDARLARSEASVRARMRGFLGSDPSYRILTSGVYSVHQRVAERFRVGRILLAGDAAHLNNPTGGMGMNSGIHDAHALARALASVLDGAPDSLLDHYASARRRAAVELVQASADKNYGDLVARGPDAELRNAEIRACARDPRRARAHLLDSALLRERIHGDAPRITQVEEASKETTLESYIGHRAKIGVIIPSTNTAVEYDLQKVLPRGVTWHPARFFVEHANLSSDGDFLHFLELIRREVPNAVRDVLTCEPTHMMMGMSAETFWGGLRGNEEFVARLRTQIGNLGLTTGANAVVDALTRFGAKRIAVMTPYQPIGDENVRRFFGDMGFDVKRVIGLKCPSATAIAKVAESRVLETVRGLDGDDVDAIVQVGTNLSTVNLFPVLEKWLGKPCLPINITTIWHALRASGVHDRFDGLGRLLEEF